MPYKTAPVPAPHHTPFQDGIDHPGLWLWDSWTLQGPGDHLHLYCLALSRTDHDGAPVQPRDRNSFAFHIRHFESSDAGLSWRDRGALIAHGQVRDGSDARNVWSGSVLGLADGSVAFGFTGIRDLGPERDFLQTICVATGTGPGKVAAFPDAAISCPLRDYDEILRRGYYLGPKAALGSRDGEEGGPIMAWRDPFLFYAGDGDLRAVWSAKISPKRPAIAQARLRKDGDRLSLIELGPPIELPDAHLMTQAEVPKVYRDGATGDYLLLVSACDRQHEGQPDSEITQIHRLYRSRSPEGPWQEFSDTGSEVPGLAGLFGASLTRHDLAAGRLRVLGPYTENAGKSRHLRFSALLEIQVSASADAAQIDAG